MQFQRYNNVALATFGTYWKLKLLYDVVRSTLRRSCEFDVAILTFRKRCQYNIHGLFGHELTIQHKPTLKQLCNFDVVASASLLCALFVRRCDLTTNIVTTFCVCWVSYFSLKYNWRNHFFLLSGFSFTNIHESQDCGERGRAFL